MLRGPALEPLPPGVLVGLAEAFRRSHVPILVQARDWAALPERFRREIERRYFVLAEAA